MIRVVDSELSARERFGLDVLIDLSRAARVLDARSNVVELHVAADAGAAPDDPTRELRSPRFDVADGRVTVSRATLHAVAALAGAVAEQRTDASDRHGRVPASANALVAAGDEREPLVSIAATALRTAIVAAAGRRATGFVRPWPAGRRWAAALTHDVDVVSWWPLFTALRGVELARKRRWRDVASVATSALAGAAGSPVAAALAHILEVERSAGVLSTWFMLCGRPTLSTFRQGDLTYAGTGKGARAVVDTVLADGHEVGLHGSFATFRSASAFTAQREALRSIGAEGRGVRQHFLRARPPVTQRAMREAGFAYDATLGFSDRNGFRLGTADILPAWDDLADEPIDGLDLAPLVWMDRALSKYRGIEDPAAWIDDALDLADRCRAVDGLWVGLWHPNFSRALGYPGAAAEYERLVRTLVERGAWTATLGEIVTWRRARRSLRVVAVHDDGGVELGGDPSSSSSSRFELENAAGHPLSLVPNVAGAR